MSATLYGDETAYGRSFCCAQPQLTQSTHWDAARIEFSVEEDDSAGKVNAREKVSRKFAGYVGGDIGVTVSPAGCCARERRLSKSPIFCATAASTRQRSTPRSISTGCRPSLFPGLGGRDDGDQDNGGTCRSLSGRTFHARLQHHRPQHMIAADAFAGFADGQGCGTRDQLGKKSIAIQLSLHTGEVQGSIPCAPTRNPIESAI